MSEILHATNRQNQDTHRQLFEQVDPKKWLGHDRVDALCAFWVDADDWIMALNALRHYFSLCEYWSGQFVTQVVLCVAPRLSVKAFVPAVHSSKSTAGQLNRDTFSFKLDNTELFWMFKTFIRCSHHLKDKKDKVVNYAQKNNCYP